MSASSARKTITLREAAEIMGVSQSTMYAAAREGDLPFPVLRIKTRYVIPAAPFHKAISGDNEKSAA